MTPRLLRSARLSCALPGALLFTLTAGLAGCGEDDLTCTAELRLIGVQVSAPDGVLVDRVTVENRSEQECEHQSGAKEPQPGGSYQCGEQGGGSYVFRAYVGDRVWSTNVTFTSDGCHIDHSSGPTDIAIEGEGEEAEE